MQDFNEQKKELINSLINKGINHPQVLAAMQEVPRHAFVEHCYLAEAYADIPLPIALGQTISQPFIVAQMTQLLLGEFEHLGKVLEIGTGSGYQAAILSSLADEVYSIEIIKSLYELATKRFKLLGYPNIFTQLGDGKRGWPEHSPYAGIIVTAAPEQVPQALLKQLADGANMVIPVGEQGMQHLEVITRQGDDFERKVIELVSFVPLV